MSVITAVTSPDFASGAKSWILRYRAAGTGKPCKYGLGATRTVSLAEARDAAEAARKLLRSGLDPRAEARRQKVAAARLITFDKAAAAFIDSRRASWRNARHAEQWQTTLKSYASPVLGALPVSQIDTALVLRVLQPIWTSKTETASRVRGRIEQVLSWSKAHGYRSGENPATWRGHLDHLLPAPGKLRKVTHHAALPYDELAAFMQQLRARHGWAALALQFAILTATRTSETLQARWGEFDLDKAVWTIPGERMKGGREHRVPLSERAVTIVRELATVRHGGFIFPGHRHDAPLSRGALPRLLRRMRRGDLTTHGFRATFRTWCAEKTNFPRELCEAALAHVVGDKVEAAYQRGDLLDKRRQLMAAWAGFIEGHGERQNVVALR
jgi:integrase